MTGRGRGTTEPAQNGALGDPLSALAADLLPLVLFAVILLPLSFVAFRYAVKRAKIEGSLTEY